jgi:NADH-quinone oxidoreductase subunit F
VAACEPVLLANIANPDSHTLAAYEATGGYRTWRAVLAEQSPQDVQDLVKDSALRGRGSGRFWPRIVPARFTSA